MGRPGWGRFRRLEALGIGGLLCAMPVTAQPAFGGAYTALPGFFRVPVAEPTSEPMSAAASLAYGMTESQVGEAGAHQRFGAIAAIGATPFGRLQSSLRADARYDRHPRDGQGENSGSMVTPSLALRWIEPLSSSIALGAEAGIRLPGTESVSVMVAAASPHVALFGTWRAGQMAVAMLAGYRLDRSAAASPDLQGIRFGDRVALGLSDFDAVLFGLGAGYVLGDARVFIEANAEVLLGSEVAFLQSPLSASAGARYDVSDWWAIELIGSACASERPSLTPSDPLIPIEPRFTVLAGTRLRLPFSSTGGRHTPERHVIEGPAIRASAPQLVRLELDVRLDPTKPATATATLSRGGRDYPMQSLGSNRFLLPGVVAGGAVLRVRAAGYRESVETIEIPDRALHQLELQLALELQAQVRGLVRSFAGTPLPARVVVEPLGIHGTTDADGFFQLDVPPGTYSVVIEADGYRSQRRDVVVEKDGVVILNTDLLRAP
jgi:hypothetical protein